MQKREGLRKRLRGNEFYKREQYRRALKLYDVSSHGSSRCLYFCIHVNFPASRLQDRILHEDAAGRDRLSMSLFIRSSTPCFFSCSSALLFHLARTLLPPLNVPQRPSQAAKAQREAAEIAGEEQHNGSRCPRDKSALLVSAFIVSLL
eukprot:695800-Hanusia_phi.AAC.2